MNCLTTQQKRMDKPGEVTIDLSPLYQDANEDTVHGAFFEWRRDEVRVTSFDSMHKEPVVTFVSSYRLFETVNNKTWTNPNAIDLSGLPSLNRILIIGDITKRLREKDEQKDEDNKMLTGNAKTTITFKLDSNLFSLRMNPTRDQPGNALLTMQGSHGGRYGDTHKSVERFGCFASPNADKIESIVKRARREGRQINIGDIDIDKPDQTKETLAEQMTFFMLLYDFEVARHLQRPFVYNSQDLDSLSIDVGIAMIHRINSQREYERWMFFSDLFRGDGQSRKKVLDELVPIDLPGRLDLLHEQFAAF